MIETWKEIKNYEELYHVSTFGKVKSLKTNQIIKPFLNKTGYLMVDLYKDGVKKRFTIHKLVAKTFIENPLNKPHINHIDGNKTNNNVQNLEWCTPAENLIHAYKLGLKKAPAKFGKDNIHSKTVNQYSLDGTYLRTFDSAGEGARYIKQENKPKGAIETIRTSILHCCRKDRLVAYGYKWSFE